MHLHMGKDDSDLLLVREYKTKPISEEWFFDSTICSCISVSKSKPSLATDRTFYLLHTSPYIKYNLAAK